MTRAGPREPRSRRLLRILFLVFAMAAFAVIGVFGYIAATKAPPTPAPTPDVTSPVDGVVVSVDAASLGDVRGFTLRVSGGFAFAFKLGQLENPTEFAPGHLAEHQATSSLVRVYFRVESGERVVYRLEDAPG